MNFQKLNINLNQKEFKKDSYSILRPLGQNQPRGPAFTVQAACSAWANSGLAAWPKAARDLTQIAAYGRLVLDLQAAGPAHGARPQHCLECMQGEALALGACVAWRMAQPVMIGEPLNGDKVSPRVLPRPTEHSRGNVISTILHLIVEAAEEGGSPAALWCFDSGGQREGRWQL
jgi:hypothetical protein